MPYLSLLIWLPVVTAGLVLLSENIKLIKGLVYVCMFASVVLCLLIIDSYNFNLAGMQFTEHLAWIANWNAAYLLGVDGITMPLVVLTVFIHGLIILMAKQMAEEQYKQYLAVFLSLQGFTIGVFTALDSLLFYFFWEAMLIPMYLCIGIWGGAARNYASIKFFLYTFFGSALLLLAIIYLGFSADSFAWQDLVNLPLSLTVQNLLFIGFFMAFAVKVPMWPLHTWLPDAHTEAPAAGSVILAALMLKVGAYGFFRFCLPILPDACRYFAPAMIIMSLVAIVYIGLVALAQKDMKRLIAYSSVAHMGFVTLGCFIIYELVDVNYARLALEGAIMQMIAHAFGSGAMFLAFGLLYQRYHTRLLDEFGGIANVMPVFTACFMIFALTNVGLPGTAGFVGEFTVILSSFNAHPGIALLGGLTLIIGAAYTLWMFKRVFYGEAIRTEVLNLVDVNQREKLVLITLVVVIFMLGLMPEIVLKSAHSPVKQLVNQALVSKIKGVV